MANELNGYLQFQSEAREAMTFYQSIFGGELEVNTFGEFGMEGEIADGIMHSKLTTPDFAFMASDTPPGMDYSPGGSVSMCLSGEDEPQLTEWYQKLADGGQVGMKLEKQMWGDMYGDCTDKYGIKWMMNINQPQS